MGREKIIKILIIFTLAFILVLFFFNFAKKLENKKKTEKIIEESYSSNILKDVNYVSRDANGNEYIINALQGEIDLQNTNVIYLTDVSALIILESSKKITITSNYGKYNINNYDTIFNKNVKINYEENQITGEYLDFSFDRNSLIISRNVIYTNEENILNADVIEMDINTKDTKIFMYSANEKVNIKSKD
tara:strand:+ start:363 stop:932 length:570 start_codon:yes stop_codon:yes gene_type:complete